MAIYTDKKVKYSKGYGDTNINAVCFGELPFNDVIDYNSISHWIDVKIDTSYIGKGLLLGYEGEGYADTNVNALCFGEIPFNEVHNPRGSSKIISEDGDIIFYEEYFIDR